MPTNPYQKIENLNLAIESARSIGCMVVNVRPEFIREKREHIVLGLIWQIIRVIDFLSFRYILTIKSHLNNILKLSF